LKIVSQYTPRKAGRKIPDGYNRGKEDEEAKNIDIPKATETIECYQD